MVGEFWNNLVRLLTPNISICPHSINNAAEKFIWTSLKIQGFGWIDWKLYPQNIQVNDPSKITSCLEKLLGRRLNESDQIVYIFNMYDLPNVVKTRLDLVLKNYADMPWTDKLWIWQPTTGFVIEDLDAGNITIGLIPKQTGPEAYFRREKIISLCDQTRLITLFNSFIGQSKISFLKENQADRVIAFFKNTFPLTVTEKIDWHRIENKVFIGKDPRKIIPTLEQLDSNPLNRTAYIKWCDPALPLMKINLQDAIARYNQIIAVANETIIFNAMEGYVIEIDEQNRITTGIMMHRKEKLHA